MHSCIISSHYYFILHRNFAVQRSSKEFIQARINSIVSSRLDKTEEQSASEADHLNHVKQRVQKQHTDFSDTKSDPGTKSKQDQVKKLPISKSYSSYDASNLSADVVADMVKRLKMRQQQREQDELKVKVFTGEQRSSEADHLNHVKQRVQQQHTDFSDTKSDPGRKSTQDQEVKMPNFNSYSSYDASNLSADVVADMIKRLKLARQQQREQDKRIVFPGTKHPRYLEYPFGEVHIIGEAKNRMSSTFCEGCLRKEGACVCDDSYHTAIEISDDPEAGVAESTFDDVKLDGIQDAVESAPGINQLVTTKVEVEVEENNDRRTPTFRWRAFVIVAFLLLIVNVLIGLLFLLARPRRAQP
jgi:hypothetical protein